MMYFEDEREFQEKHGVKVKNVLGQERDITQSHKKISVIKILKISDITEEMKNSLRKSFMNQMFEVTALTECCGITCERTICLGFDLFIKFMKNDFYYDYFLEGINDYTVVEDFYKKINN